MTEIGWYRDPDLLGKLVLHEDFPRDEHGLPDANKVGLSYRSLVRSALPREPRESDKQWAERKSVAERAFMDYQGSVSPKPDALLRGRKREFKGIAALYARAIPPHHPCG